MAAYSSLLPKAKVFRIENRDKLQIMVSRILIDESVRNLREFGESFMSDVDASGAYRARKRMLKQFDGEKENVSIKAYPAEAEDPDTKTECRGYLFKLFRNS